MGVRLGKQKVIGRGLEIESEKTCEVPRRRNVRKGKPRGERLARMWLASLCLGMVTCPFDRFRPELSSALQPYRHLDGHASPSITSRIPVPSMMLSSRPRALPSTVQKLALPK